MRYVIWSLTTYLLTALIIFWSADSGRWSGLISKALGRGKNIPSRALWINRLILAIAAVNAVLIPLAVFHIANQPDHPAETGVIGFVALMVLLPILNLAVLLRSAPRPAR